MSKTTAGHVHHAFSTFIWRPLHNNNAKPPNATFCGGGEDTMRNVLFLFLSLDKVLENWTPGETACIWQIEWVQIDPNRSDKVGEDKNLVFGDAFTTIFSATFIVIVIERFNPFLRFFASLINNDGTLKKCYLFSYRYKNFWDIGI